MHVKYICFAFHILNYLNFLHISKLQEMEEEAKVAPMSYRTQMLSQLRNYRREIDQLSRALASNFLHSEFLNYMKYNIYSLIYLIVKCKFCFV